MRTGLVAFVVVFAIPAGVGGASSAAQGPPVVNCQSRPQVIPPRHHPARIDPAVRRASVVAGPVLFVGAKEFSRGQLEAGRGRLVTIKAPMVVDAGRAVTLTISPPPGRRAKLWAGLDHDNPPSYEVRGRRIELQPCSPNAMVAGRRVGRRTTFLGGFKVAGRMCLGLRVRVHGRPKPIERTIRFGKRHCSAG